jgi:hypothetical protein
MALGPQEEFEKEEASDTKKGSKQDEKEKGAEAEEGENDDAATAKAAASPPSKPTKVAGTGGALSGKAFQRLEFLVGGEVLSRPNKQPAVNSVALFYSSCVFIYSR